MADENIFEQRYIIGYILIALLILFAAVGYKYYTGDPLYTMAELQKSIKHQDKKLFDKYIDIDSITSFLSDKLMDTLDARTEAKDTSSQLNSIMVKGLIRDSHNAFAKHLKEYFHQELIESGKQPELTVKQIKNQGDYLRSVTLEDKNSGKTFDIKLGRKKEGLLWRVVSLDIETMVEIGILDNEPDMAGMFLQLSQSGKSVTGSR